MDLNYSISGIIIVSLVTGLIRSTPFIIFRGKSDLPGNVRFLGNVLPPAIMIILVIYCLRNINLTVFPYGIVEITSVFIVIITHLLMKNTVLSILLGTGTYMLLIR